MILSKQGEPMPETAQKYHHWMALKIMEAVENGDFGGIHPAADGGLKDDLRHWAYGQKDHQRVISYIDELLKLVPEKLKTNQVAYHAEFIVAARNIKFRMQHED